ncbi:MAG TPA: hypothetical protein VKU41_32640, partial [Polyangiaceae bacterium]|nr:hypothetical protein [Polyangiaceae bacterium]
MGLRCLFARRVAWCVLCVLVILPRLALADPIDPKAVPEALRPWVGWALDGKPEGGCPFFLGRSDFTRCAWPSRIELTLDEHGGRFKQIWHADAPEWVPLPGDDNRWPADVKVDGVRSVAIDRSGPRVHLAAGDPVLTGTFAWDSLPESIRVPPETGLVALVVRGKPAAWPNRDADGTVWLQKAATNEEGDALEVVVHRKLADD